MAERFDFVVGVDTHKKTHTFVVLDRVACEVLRFTVGSDVSGCEDAIAKVSSLGIAVWGIEGTGVYGRHLAEMLLKRGDVVFEVPGSVTRRYRKRDRGKSDPLDAKAIAEAVLRERERLPRYERCDEREAVRLLYDRRDRIIRERTEAINRLRAAVLRLGRTDLPRDLARKKSLASVNSILLEIPASDYTTTELLDDAREAISDIERCNERVRGIEKKLGPFVERMGPEVLKLRGISTVIAAGIIGHSGDIRNCRNAAAYAMRAGVAPIPCSSGANSRVRVNPGGNRQLNRCLHIVALVQICAKETHPGKIFYERKRKEGKTHRAALRALKRHLATIVFYRLRDNLGAEPRHMQQIAA